MKKVKEIKPKHQNPEKIWVLGKKNWMWLTVAEIVYCQTNSDCTLVYMENREEHNISGNLSETMRLIDSDYFFDIHQSYRINLKFWDGKEIDRDSRLIGLTVGISLPVAILKLPYLLCYLNFLGLRKP